MVFASLPFSGPDDGRESCWRILGSRAKRRERYSYQPKAGSKGHCHDPGSLNETNKALKIQSVEMEKSTLHSQRVCTRKAKPKVKVGFWWRTRTWCKDISWRESSTGLPGSMPPDLKWTGKTPGIYVTEEKEENEKLRFVSQKSLMNNMIKSGLVFETWDCFKNKISLVFDSFSSFAIYVTFCCSEERGWRTTRPEAQYNKWCLSSSL